MRRKGAAGPNVHEKANSVASGASFAGAATRKRTLDELQDAVEELGEAEPGGGSWAVQSKAHGVRTETTSDVRLDPQ